MKGMEQTIETLGLPFVGYKLRSESIAEHIREIGANRKYCGLPHSFLEPCFSSEEFLGVVSRCFCDVINEALKDKEVCWSVSKITATQFGKTIAAGTYVFNDIPDYGTIREVMHSLDWDEISVSVIDAVDTFYLDKVTVALRIQCRGVDIDRRWIDLWLNDYKFDQVFWSAYEKTDIMQWRGYAVDKGYFQKPQSRAIDFISWAIMTQDYDEFMQLISDDKQTNTSVGVDLFATINTTTNKTNNNKTNNNQTTNTPIKESGQNTAMTNNVFLTAQSPVSEDEQKKYFNGALQIPQVAASRKEWSRTGTTFETIKLYAVDVDACFTCDTKIVSTTNKPSKKRFQWIEVDGTKFYWSSISSATSGFAAYSNGDFAGMAKFMTLQSALKWRAMLNGDEPDKQLETVQKQPETAKTTANVAPKEEQPKTSSVKLHFKGDTYKDPNGDGIYFLVWESDNSCHVYGINSNGKLEYNRIIDKAAAEKCIAANSLEKIDAPKEYHDILRKLNLLDIEEVVTEAKQEAAQTETVTPTPSQDIVNPADKHPITKADRLVIDKRDGGLFISGADEDTANWIMAYVDSINAMKERTAI